MSPMVPVRVAGRVVDGGNAPVAGARLTFWTDPRTFTAGGDGNFDVTTQLPEREQVFWITVAGDGFETSELSRPVVSAGQTTLRVYPIRVLAAGESVHLTVNPDDPACGYHWGYICRRVRVRSDAPGALSVNVTAVAGVTFGMLVGSQGFPQQLVSHVSIHVTAGSETPVEIATAWPLATSSAFDVATSFIPD
jgi:hypothetical protein